MWSKICFWLPLFGSKSVLHLNYKVWILWNPVWLHNVLFCILDPLFGLFLLFLWPLNCPWSLTAVKNMLLANHFYYPTMHFEHFGIQFGFIRGDFVFLTLFRSYSWVFFGPCKPLESNCGHKYASSCLF